jgi:NADH:ubiquinone oxidoreductase subunit 6 (subunit J)
MIFYRYIAEFMFFLFIFLTFAGALLAVRARLLMHAVLGLAVSFLGVAGLYFYLGSLFLSMMQILIYVGAICIVIVFGIMVGYTPEQLAKKKIAGKNLLLGVSAAVVVFSLLFVAIWRTAWVPAVTRVGDFSLAWLGQNLLYNYCLAFELISVVLLAAIVGAIILAGEGREEKVR